MILTFPEVITADEQRAILAQIATAEFVDGRQTAAAQLSDRKHNEQIHHHSAQLKHITDILLGTLRRHDGFCGAVYPSQLHSLMVSRYREGMHYGPHVDRALMGDTAVWRTDLSVTLFLNEPAEYDGGELALESGSGAVRIKLPARALVCYPTGQIHQVLPVTRGERLVVVAWIQSHVRDAGAREALGDLAMALATMRARDDRTVAYELVNKTHTNLLRRWAEP